MTAPEPGDASGVGRSRVTVVIDDRCTACGLCLATCPDRALLPAPKRPLVVDARCSGCGACLEVCPVDAISERFEGRR